MAVRAHTPTTLGLNGLVGGIQFSIRFRSDAQDHGFNHEGGNSLFAGPGMVTPAPYGEFLIAAEVESIYTQAT